MPCFLSKTDLDRLPRQAPDNDQEIKLTITTGGRFLFAQGIQAKTFPSLFRLTPPRSSSRVSSCRCASTSSNSTQVRKCISFAILFCKDYLKCHHFTKTCSGQTAMKSTQTRSSCVFFQQSLASQTVRTKPFCSFAMPFCTETRPFFAKTGSGQT
jgi:hypothetical protein